MSQLSHSEHLFREFSSDLSESEHKFVDVTVTCYAEENNGPGSMPRFNVVQEVVCHRLVLGCKSAFLRRALASCEDSQRDGHAHISLVGVSEVEMEQLMHELYDAAVPKVRLWRREDEEVGRAAPFQMPLQVKLEEEEGAEEMQEERYEDVKEDYFDGIEEVAQEEEDWEGEEDEEEEDPVKPRTRQDELRDMAKAKSPALSYKTVWADSLEMSFKFDRIYENGSEIAFVKCKICTEVFDYPLGGEAGGGGGDDDDEAAELNTHVQEGCCEADIAREELLNEREVMRKEQDAMKKLKHPVSRSRLNKMFASKSRRISVIDFKPEDKKRYKLGGQFQYIKFLGQIVNFLWCKSCKAVLIFDLARGKFSDPAVHACVKRSDRNSDKDPVSMEEPADEFEDLVKREKVTKAELQQLIEDKSPLVTTKKNCSPYNFSQLKVGANMKLINYKGERSSRILCVVCNRVVDRDEITSHYCFVILSIMHKVFIEEPERITTKDEVINYKFPFIRPILLDGHETETAQCHYCKKFDLKGTVVENETNTIFYHRCMELAKHRLSKYTFSDNVKITPIKGRKKTFVCKLCDLTFYTDHNTEIHMRTEHNEGGKEVPCSFCGQGFPTIRKVRDHELQSHLLSSDVVNRFACTKCDKKFRQKDKLERHFKGIHSEVRPFVCDTCGKGFNFETTMRNHMFTHGERTFKCEFCEKSFRHRATYVDHRRIHTGEKPHECPFCGHRFISITACKIHVKGRHGVIIPKGQGIKSFTESLRKQKESV